MRRIVGAVGIGLAAAGCFVDPGKQSTAGGTDGGQTSGPEATTTAAGTTGAEAPTTSAGPTSEPPVNCGDGVVDGDEECDDANAVNTDTCTFLCKLAVCGDGFVQPGETCDQGSGNADNGGCTLVCVPAVCGDGKVQAGIEGCDDGNKVDADGCSNACVPTSCGDGVAGAGEECDDGNDLDADDCKNNCTVAFCGDGVVADQGSMPETCDDGNQVEDDGCTSMCTPSQGNVGCGDGVIDVGEACDDGNKNDGDTCSSACVRTAYRVFVTSQAFAGKLDGALGADQICEQLVGAGNFKAWISDEKSTAGQRLFHSGLPYIRTDDVVVAMSWDELTSGDLLAPIDHDEDGTPVDGMNGDVCDQSGAVWTGTQADGDGTSQQCNDWQNDGGALGSYGVYTATDPHWTEACVGNCNLAARLYCFEQP